MSNTSSFCIAAKSSVGGMYSSCLIGVPTPLELLRNHTMFKSFDRLELRYKKIYNLGKTTRVKEKGMLRVKVRGTVPAQNCVEFINCSVKWENLT